MARDLQQQKYDDEEARLIDKTMPRNHKHIPRQPPANAPTTADIIKLIESVDWTVWDRLLIHDSLINLRTRKY